MSMKRTYSTVIQGPATTKKRSTKRGRYVARIPRNINGVQPQLRSTLKYVDHVTRSPVSTGAYSYVFRANSVYDPDSTGVGHQPMGFDEIMAMYKHFYVTKSRIKVTAIDSSSSSGINPMYGIIASSTGVEYAGASISKILENQYHSPWQTAITSVSAPSRSTSMQIDFNKWFNTKDLVGENDKRGSDSVNPSQEVYYHVWMGNPAATPSSSIAFLVEIEYDCVFCDPNTLNQS